MKRGDKDSSTHKKGLNAARIVEISRTTTADRVDPNQLTNRGAQVALTCH